MVSAAGSKTGWKAAKVLSFLILLGGLDLTTAQIAEQVPWAYSAPRIVVVPPPPQNTIEALVLPPPRRERIQRHSQLWRDLSHNRVHELVGGRGDKRAALHRVVTRLVGARAEESRPAGVGEKSVETIILPPYLELVVFDIFRGPGKAEVAVFAPDALRPLTSEVEGVEVVRLGEIHQTIVIRHPMPGQWTFRKSNPDARVKIFSQQFFPRGILVDPTAAKTLRQYDRIAVAYRVIDGNGLPLEELPGYPLSLEISLVKPDGARDTLGMQRRPELGPAVFRTRREAECDLAGRYWTEVIVTTRDLNDQRVKVFQDHWSGFSVAAAKRIDCRVTAPGLGEPMVYRRRLLWAQPVATRVECFDPKAQPVEMKPLVRGSLTRLFQPLLSHEGKPTEAALDLEYLGRGAFQGWLRGAGSPGFYRLQLSVDRAQLASAYNIRFLPSDTSFARHLRWLDWVLILVLAAAVPAGLVWVGRKVWKHR